MAQSEPSRIRAIREHAHAVTDSRRDYEPLMRLVGNSRFTLLGEASHGTHEFYNKRAQITQWLIKEKGYSAVAVEADWPDAHRVNRYVQGPGEDRDAAEALAPSGAFRRGCGAQQGCCRICRMAARV